MKKGNGDCVFVVAAHAPVMLVAFWGVPLECDRVPVLAWAITMNEDGETSTMPVISEGLPPVWCLEMGGQFVFPEDCAVTTEAEALAHARTMIKGD